MIQLNLPKIYTGKVRDLYEIDRDRMLMVASDRLSAFDVVFKEEIPHKGELLTQMSNNWFDFFKELVPSQFTGETVFDVLPEEQAEVLKNRAVVVKRLQPIKLEAVVRGYITGSGWRDYQATGTIAGIDLPTGLRRSEKLAEPIFTPSTKAEIGTHDETINFEQAKKIVGEKLAEQVKTTSLRLYKSAAAYALTKGIIIADTKFEFGLDKDGQLTLMDEVLTPDSSRYWAVSDYQIDEEPPSYDKQFVRNFLIQQDWNKQPPAPKLPSNVLKKTQDLYAEIFYILFQKKY